ncbi:hypothetical protein ABK040_014270 [Willaertia magna]
MTRKQAFSAAKKKAQLQDKRKKKKEKEERKEDLYDWSKWKDSEEEIRAGSSSDNKTDQKKPNQIRGNPEERINAIEEESEQEFNQKELTPLSESEEENSDNDSALEEEDDETNKSSKKKEYTSMVTSEYKLATKFSKESEEEIQKRKLESLQPLPVYLEVSDDKAPHPSKFKSLQVEVNEGYKSLDFPKKPDIDYTSLKKGQMERFEEEYFEKYLQEVIGKYKTEELNYFEENLHVWKQLWKTIELSDILLIVADIRHPLFHFPPSLYNYITNELKKPFLLILNKCDLISEEKQQIWIKWFKENYPNVTVCLFTRGTGSGKKSKSKEVKLEELQLIKRYSKTIWQTCKKLYKEYKISGLKKTIKEEQEKVEELVESDFDELIDACDKVELPTPQPKLKLKKKERKRREAIKAGLIPEDEEENVEEEKDVVDEKDEKHGHDITSDIDKKYDGCVIGFIGHPNVGKSSIINALTGKKVVSTSYTPGHTKHYQTIFLDTKNKMIQLCDCPGLVFPAVGVSKSLQILSGIFPISQVRDPYSIVRYLAERVDLVKKLKLKKDEYDIENNIPWSAWTVCEAYAVKRGYMTKKNGRPDVYRGANELLRKVLKGDDPALILAFSPPTPLSKTNQENIIQEEEEIEPIEEVENKKGTKGKKKKYENLNPFDYLKDMEELNNEEL